MRRTAHYSLNNFKLSTYTQARSLSLARSIHFWIWHFTVRPSNLHCLLRWHYILFIRLYALNDGIITLASDNFFLYFDSVEFSVYFVCWPNDVIIIDGNGDDNFVLPYETSNMHANSASKTIIRSRCTTQTNACQKCFFISATSCIKCSSLQFSMW